MRPHEGRVVENISPEEAALVIDVSSDMRAFVATMKKMGMTKKEAKDGFLRMVNLVWDET